MFEIIEKGLKFKDASKADLVQIRGQRRTITLCTFLNGTVEAFSHITFGGISARTLVEGKSWGFSSTSNAKKDDVEGAVTNAVKLAKASAKSKSKKIALEPVKAESVKISAPCQRPVEKAPRANGHRRSL